VYSGIDPICLSDYTQPMPSEIKPTALRIQPAMKARVQVYADKYKFRSLHAATLDALDKGLTVGDVPGGEPAPPKVKAPRKAKATKTQSEPEPLAPPEPQIVPVEQPTKPSLKDWLSS
jgi:hypothetical protein